MNRTFRGSRFAGLIALGLVAASGGVPLSAATPGSGPAVRPDRGPLPDTVLARIEGTRTVTIGDFRRAWAQLEPPARPDSLTPQGARQFLDLLIGKEVLGLHALRQGWQWTPFESAQYVGLRDRLMLQAALDSLLAELRAARARARDSTLDAVALGIMARDSAARRLGVRFDNDLVARLAPVWAALPRPSRDSSLSAQLRAMGALPQVPPSDTGRVVAESDAGPYRVAELLESWKRTSPLQRPRIETVAQVQDLVRNGLFERALRRESERRRLDLRPDIARQLQARREYFAVARLVEREVTARLPRLSAEDPPARRARDSLELRAFYRRHLAEYDLPRTATVTRLLLPDRAAAGRMAARLRDPAEAETIRAVGRRAGVEYGAEITLESDSALFVAATRAGPGTVVGPDSVAGGWQVARVESIRDPRHRGFEEALPLVEHHYHALEGERMMQELIAARRRRTRVELNPRALERLVASGSASVGARP
jgi:parvulin-like peptidyl-prolyl cis-trans isomerase-like protein